MNPGVLVSELYAKHIGRPILVVGGGPSAPAQAEKIVKRFSDMIVISANGHAWKLGLRPDYTFCKDHIHTELKVPMEGMLRGLDSPIVTMHYWADYRAAKWPIQGNSGQHAIALAALMGGKPIIPIGIDCFQGDTYFHTPKSSNISLGRPEGYWKSRMERLAGRLEGAVVRTVGPMLGPFPRFRPDEELPRPKVPHVFAAYEDCPTHYIRAVHRFVMPQDPRSEVPVGRILPVTAGERDLFVRQGVAVGVESRNC